MPIKIGATKSTESIPKNKSKWPKHIMFDGVALMSTQTHCCVENIEWLQLYNVWYRFMSIS